MLIEYHPVKNYRNPNHKFSILIPTWNNLDYLKNCINSIRNNSTYEHQIIVHINHGDDGTTKWVQQQDIDYTSSPQNIGICFALNAAATLAKTDYIVYMNDDMYVLPEWDKYLANEIDNLSDDRFFLSSTMIEPTNNNNPCVIYCEKYGNDLKTFREQELLDTFQALEKQDWVGATWPPNIVSRKLWNEVGGYSIEYSPGFTSDPDFSMKLWKAGVRYYKGLSASRVFHFQCKSTGRIQRNDGKKQFLKKWGISAKNFTEIYLKRGKAFNGKLNEPNISNIKFLKDKFRYRFKS